MSMWGPRKPLKLGLIPRDSNRLYKGRAGRQKKALTVARAVASGRVSSSGWQVPRGFVGARGDAKFFDLASATYACNTSGSITHLSVIPQGTTVSSREGKSSRVTSVSCRGSIRADVATTVADYAVYLVWDYQPNKALAAILDVLDTVSSASFPKRENNARFKIIKKYTGSLSGNVTTPAAGNEIVRIDDYIKLPKDANIMCTVADTTGAIGNVIQGALLLVTCGDVVAGTADANAILGFRMNFTDQLN